LGEITIVLHGFDASTKSYSGDELVNLVLERESAGMSRKDAIGIVAKQLDLPKRQVFDALVAHKSADKI
jgi:16S rRNA (cytidine1402-2'-O)-methyltransferase